MKKEKGLSSDNPFSGKPNKEYEENLPAAKVANACLASFALILNLCEIQVAEMPIMLPLVLLIDNFDSFTFNLADYIRQCGAEVEVVRNNVSVNELTRIPWQSIILSPGPQTPRQAGNLMEIIDAYVHQLPVLGICLGHQALGAYFGGVLTRAKRPMHGKVSRISCHNDPIFENIPASLEVVRYHSLILEQLPSLLETIAWSADQEIMALRHQTLPIRGIQFHPEAALTQYGLEMIRNWLNFARTVG